MAKYLIIKDSITRIGEAKTGLEVTFTDEVNGKEDVTNYQEIESQDEEVIKAELEKVALEYEARPAKIEKEFTLATGKAVNVIAKEPIITEPVVKEGAV